MSKVWMITGAGRGLGRAFAEQALRSGDCVIATVRKPDEHDPLFRHENILPVCMDVTDRDAVAQALEQGVQRFGRVDVLVNNAGFGMSGAFEEVSDEELRVLFETDYFGVVNVTRAVLPLMRKQGGGMILNVSSQAGAMGMVGSSAYCSAKFAVVGLSESLRAELAPFHIQVASVLPGAFRTDFRDKSSMHLPQNKMDEYQHSDVGQKRDFLLAHNHTQEGDPARAAQFLYDLVAGGTLPTRILIGEKCCAQVKQHYETLLDEIASYEAAASRTAYET